MEQLLDLYEKGYDPEYPVVCFDERPAQLISNVIAPVAMKPGAVKKIDYHYKRNGTCSILSAIEPLTGRRLVEVRKQRKKPDYAEFMKTLERKYPKAFGLTERFEMVYTPKSASWLNMAEIEFSALSKQCLDRRIGDIKELTNQVLIWSKEREQKKIKIKWQFTKQDARIKLKRHYQKVKLVTANN